jgi:hypothetical protein
MWSSKAYSDCNKRACSHYDPHTTGEFRSPDQTFSRSREYEPNARCHTINSRDKTCNWIDQQRTTIIGCLVATCKILSEIIVSQQTVWVNLTILTLKCEQNIVNLFIWICLQIQVRLLHIMKRVIELTLFSHSDNCSETNVSFNGVFTLNHFLGIFKLYTYIQKQDSVVG